MKNKRTLKDIHRYYEAAAIVDLVRKAQTFEYVFEPKKKIRDKALLAVLAATRLRISEVLSLDKDQIEKAPDAIFIRDVRILKRRKEIVYKDFPIFYDSVYGPLAGLFWAWAELVTKGLLFPIERDRAYRIVKKMSGKWCHWFRAQGLSYLVTKLRGTRPVADIQGIKKSDTLDQYSKTTWKSYEKELRE